jgi:hypothetical protein
MSKKLWRPAQQRFEGSGLILVNAYIKVETCSAHVLLRLDMFSLARKDGEKKTREKAIGQQEMKRSPRRSTYCPACLCSYHTFFSIS